MEKAAILAFALTGDDGIMARPRLSTILYIPSGAFNGEA